MAYSEAPMVKRSAKPCVAAGHDCLQRRDCRGQPACDSHSAASMIVFADGCARADISRRQLAFREKYAGRCMPCLHASGLMASRQRDLELYLCMSWCLCGVRRRLTCCPTQAWCRHVCQAGVQQGNAGAPAAWRAERLWRSLLCTESPASGPRSCNTEFAAGQESASAESSCGAHRNPGPLTSDHCAIGDGGGRSSVNHAHGERRGHDLEVGTLPKQSAATTAHTCAAASITGTCGGDRRRARRR